MRSITLLPFLLLSAGLAAQIPRVERQVSRSSSSHRVVVVNGKTVVDERRVDGQPVPVGERRHQVPVDLERVMRRLLEDLRRSGDAGKRGGSRRSHWRRVVVLNGKKLVDEESRDGKPLRPR